MHGPLPPYGMIMEYKRLLEGAALPGSLNYQYIAANYFQLHSKCIYENLYYIYILLLLLLLLLLLRARCEGTVYICIIQCSKGRKRGFYIFRHP